MFSTAPALAPSPAPASAWPEGGPLRILYVLGDFPVLSETFITNEIRAMRRDGHFCAALSLTNFAGPCQPQDEAFRHEALHLDQVPAAIAGMALASFAPARILAAMQFAKAQSGIRPRSLMLAAAKTALLARRHGCTHLHAHFALAGAATAITAAKLAGLSVSFTAHGYDVYAHPADLALKLASADVAIAVCQDMLADFRALAPAGTFALVACGIEPALFRPAFAAPRNGKLLAIGRLCEQKGYEILLAALARLPAAQRPVIDIVGGGDLRASLQSLAQTLAVSESVHFLGPRPSDWIAANGPFYRGFVAPYVICANGDRDTGPVVVKEAAAMGLPVVASALMGLRESVTTQTGRLVPPRDIGALAEALRWLDCLPDEQRRQMGAAGRDHITQNFSLARQASDLAAAIHAVRR